VRCLLTGLTVEDLEPVKEKLADVLFKKIPAGVGSTGHLKLDRKEMDEMLSGGAQWAVQRGYGTTHDLERIEENGRMAGARPEEVSDQAKKRQQAEMGTLGSGNHYLEVQRVARIFAPDVAEAFGIHEGDVVVSIHCGSRGLGHQIGTDYLRVMTIAAREHGIELPDRELACAPIKSKEGQAYLGAMRAAINCALANRQILTHLVREAFAQVIPRAEVVLLYDVSHNTCKVERHQVDGEVKELYVHRTRVPEHGPAGADRGYHGHRLVHTGGHHRQHAPVVWLVLPRGGPRHEPQSGPQAVAGARRGRSVGPPWHHRA
jgi:tRNA-splicing ligase RtcB